jgi:hypothetical protein
LLDAIAMGLKNYNSPDLFINILPNTALWLLFGIIDYLYIFDIMRVGDRKKMLISQLKLNILY